MSMQGPAWLCGPAGLHFGARAPDCAFLNVAIHTSARADWMTAPERVTALLREAGTAHHQAFAQVGGEDAAWARWYADYLVQRLAALLRRDLTAPGLARALEAFEAERQRSAPGTDWAAFYAERLLAGPAPFDE